MTAGPHRPLDAITTRPLWDLAVRRSDVIDMVNLQHDGHDRSPRPIIFRICSGITRLTPRQCPTTTVLSDAESGEPAVRGSYMRPWHSAWRPLAGAFRPTTRNSSRAASSGDVNITPSLTATTTHIHSFVSTPISSTLTLCRLVVEHLTSTNTDTARRCPPCCRGKPAR